MNQEISWSIAGSDPSGGAGIQADLKTFHALGVHGCSVITALTAQNPQEVSATHYIDAKHIASQINALKNALPPKAIKIGMLGESGIIKEIIRFFRDYTGYIVLDPLMVSTSGKNLFNTNITEYISHLKKIFSFVDVLTPNLPEAEKLLGRELASYEDIEAGAQEILSMGVKSVLIKGGHFKSHDLFCQDYWTNGAESFWLANNQHNIQRNYRGTGCTLSSAIAACLALGYNIKDAVVIAKMYVTQGIRLAAANNYSASLKHTGWPEEQADLPYLADLPMHQLPAAFPDCGPEPLGLYPVVDTLAWIKRLLPIGVKTIQLRIKDKQGIELANEIQQSIEFAKNYEARLFINDHWELAIRYGAYGVHLGQKDLNIAETEKIRQAGLRLGISTHCYYEVARAHTFRPSYIACGPIFTTTSKIMPFAPQGIFQLSRWQRTLNYPLVAIGGINLARLTDILTTQVDGVAMISAITQSPDPIADTQKLLAVLEANARYK